MGIKLFWNFCRTLETHPSFIIADIYLHQESCSLIRLILFFKNKFCWVNFFQRPLSNSSLQLRTIKQSINLKVFENLLLITPTNIIIPWDRVGTHWDSYNLMTNSVTYTIIGICNEKFKTFHLDAASFEGFWTNHTCLHKFKYEQHWCASINQL